MPWILLSLNADDRPQAKKNRVEPAWGLVCMAVPSGRLMPSGRTISQIMTVPGFVTYGRLMAVPSGRLMAVPAWPLPCPA